MTELAIIRHGVTDWNVEERMQGHRDIPLNNTGLWQAQSISDRLCREHWDAIIYSDLQRAAKTALKIADAAGIAIKVSDSRLRERNLGRLEGTTTEERFNCWGADWNKLDHGVESNEDLFLRASLCIEELVRIYEQQRVIIVTHGGWIHQFFNGIFPDLMLDRPDNTSLSIIRKDAGGWQCVLYNCTNHLKKNQSAHR